jgi:hypothetical protein
MKQIRHKFNAVRTEVDNQKFSSKKEGKYYQQLKLRQKAGEVIFFLRQCPFHLKSGIKYIVDFVEFWTDGTVHFVDVKGYSKMPVYIMKKKLVEAEYPIEIEER